VAGNIVLYGVDNVFRDVHCNNSSRISDLQAISDRVWFLSEASLSYNR
jgi:hypothetical protein